MAREMEIKKEEEWKEGRKERGMEGEGGLED